MKTLLEVATKEFSFETLEQIGFFKSMNLTSAQESIIRYALAATSDPSATGLDLVALNSSGLLKDFNLSSTQQETVDTLI